MNNIIGRKYHNSKLIPHWLNVNKYKQNIPQKEDIENEDHINFKFNIDISIPRWLYWLYCTALFILLAYLFFI